MEKSLFQQQNPLSPKKFTRKMIREIGTGLFFCIFLAIIPSFISIFSFATKNLDNPQTNLLTKMMSTLVLWTVALFVLRTIIYAFYWKVYIKRYYYNADDSFITIKKGVFAPAEIHVQYGKIQDVYVDQDIIDRMLGIYDVHIASATMGSSIEAHIDGVEKDVAERLKEYFLAKMRGEVSSNNESTSYNIPKPPTQNNSIIFSKHISKETFPMNKGAWYASQIIGIVVSNVAIILVLFQQALFSKGNSNSSVTTWILLALFGLILIRIIGMIIWYKNYYFEFLPEYIVIKTGIFSRSENHVPYRTVQDIRLKQTFLDRLLGISSIIIENAAFGGVGMMKSSGIVIVGQPINQAREMSEILKETLLSHKSNANIVTGL